MSIETRGARKPAVKTIDTRAEATRPHRIVITGSGGVIVTPLRQQLQKVGFDVLTIGRKEVGDINESTDWSSHLAVGDCVIHCAARAHVMREEAADPLQAFRTTNVYATSRLAKQCVRAGVRRFIHISSISVNGGNSPGRPFTSEDIPQPLSPYAISKVEAEAVLQEFKNEMEVVVVRPPVILGDNPKGNFATLLKLMRKGIPLPFGLVQTNRRQIVTIERLIALIQACITDAEAVGKTILVADRELRSTREICQILARRHGLEARFLPVPPVFLEMILRLSGRKSMIGHILGDLEIDTKLAQRLLGEVDSSFHG